MPMAQPPEVFGDWPPHWYYQARMTARSLVAEGSDSSQMMNFLYYLVCTRDDPYYTEFLPHILADLEHTLSAHLDPTAVVRPLNDQEMMWARYVEDALHQEFLEEYYPQEQAQLEAQAGLLPIELVTLHAAADPESEAQRVRRKEFNRKRELPRVVKAILDLPVEGASSSSSDEMPSMHYRVHQAMGKRAWQQQINADSTPMLTQHERKVVWMQRVTRFLRQVHLEGDDGWAFQLLRQRVLGRATSNYVSRAMGYLREIEVAVAPADTMGVEPPEHISDWAIQEEASLYRILTTWEPDDEVPATASVDVGTQGQPAFMVNLTADDEVLEVAEGNESEGVEGIGLGSSMEGDYGDQDDTLHVPACLTVHSHSNDEGVGHEQGSTSNNAVDLTQCADGRWSMNMEGDTEVVQMYDLTQDEDAGDSDEVFLMDRAKPKKRWLKSRSRSRGSRRAAPAAVTTEVRRLTEAGRASARATPSATCTPSTPANSSSGTGEPKAKAKSRPRSSGDSASPAPTPGTPMSAQEARDLWFSLLGVTDEDAPADSFPTTFQCNVISETFLGLSLQDRVTFLASLGMVTQRILEVVGNLVQLARANERDNEEVEVPIEEDTAALMQQSTARNDGWYDELRLLQETLEEMTQEEKCSCSLLLLKLLDWKCTNWGAGMVVGHVTGRAADLLALLTVAFEERKGRVMECRPDEDRVMQLWQRVQPYLPMATGSRAQRGVPLCSQRPAWCEPHHQPNTPPSSPGSPVAIDSADAQPLHGDLPAVILDRELAYEREPEATEDEGQRRREEEEQYEEQRVREHILQNQKEQGRAYQEWEDRVMARSLQTGQTRSKRKGIQLELSSGSADAPRVVRRLTLPTDTTQLNICIRLVQDMEDSDADTEPVPEQPTPRELPCGTLAPGEGDCSASAGELGVDQYDQLRRALQAGTTSLAEIQGQHGQQVVEMLQVQWAMEQASDTQMTVPFSPQPQGDLYRSWLAGHTSDDQVMHALGAHGLELFQSAKALHEQGTWHEEDHHIDGPGGEHNVGQAVTQIDLAVDDLLATGPGVVQRLIHYDHCRKIQLINSRVEGYAGSSGECDWCRFVLRGRVSWWLALRAMRVTAMELARFKLLIRERFRDSAAEMFRFLDDNRSGRVNRVTFSARLQTLHYRGKTSSLFQYLDRQGLGILTVHSLAFLDRWHLPPYLYYQPDPSGLRVIKAKLLELHKYALIAWRKIDKDCSMRISYDEFRNYWADLLTNNKAVAAQAANLPRSESDVASAWRAMDKDCSGYIQLRDWDYDSHKHLAEFKQWADRVHGSVVAAFRALDVGGNGVTSNCGFPRPSSRGAPKGTARARLMWSSSSMAWMSRSRIFCLRKMSSSLITGTCHGRSGRKEPRRQDAA
ncbi:unnamed protein product [Symbiodinium sp. CCMP2592]|nr:unnamed protein product [Symbiodinium sp. CCMP2592]